MKILLSVCLWLAALALATMMLIAILRGRPVVLGTRSSRIVGMALFLLVLFGVGAESLRGQQEESTAQEEKRRLLESMPQLLRSEAFVSIWRRGTVRSLIDDFFTALDSIDERTTEADQSSIEARKLQLLGAAPFPEGAREVVQSILKNRFAGSALAHGLESRDVLRALDLMESSGAIHPGQIRMFWKALPSVIATDREGALQIATRLHLQARIHNALVAASFGVQPFNVRAWMGKAGMRPEERMAEARSVGHIMGALPYEFARTDAGLWDKEARAQVTLLSESAVKLERGGKTESIDLGGVVELSRLSALRTSEPTTVEHDWIGRIQLPGKSLLFVFDLPSHLDDSAKARVLQVVSAALEGDEDAAARIERSLPFTHVALREGLAAKPDAKGAPLLRLMLSLFE
jgi:hypothetical protein